MLKKKEKRNGQKKRQGNGMSEWKRERERLHIPRHFQRHFFAYHDHGCISGTAFQTHSFIYASENIPDIAGLVMNYCKPNCDD